MGSTQSLSGTLHHAAHLLTSSPLQMQEASLKSQNTVPAILLVEFCAFLGRLEFLLLEHCLSWRRPQYFLALSLTPSSSEIAPVISTMQMGTLSHPERVNNPPDTPGKYSALVWLSHVSSSAQAGLRSLYTDVLATLGSRNQDLEAIHCTPSWLKEPFARCYHGIL